jgi:hypothetical protein
MSSDYAYGEEDPEHPLKTTPGKEFNSIIQEVYDLST